MRPDHLPGQGTFDAGIAGQCHRIRDSGHVRPAVGADVGEVRRRGNGKAHERGYLQVRLRDSTGHRRSGYPEAINQENSMQSRTHSKSIRGNTLRGLFAATLGAASVLATALIAFPASAHHSFAPYNMETIKVVTGVVTRVNPDANHLQI